VDAADQIFVSDAGTSLKKADIAAIAKYIVENYAGSTISGSAQSVQAAIGALNSRTNYKVIQTQLNLPSSVSIDAGSIVPVFSNADLRTYTVSALDKPLTSGTLKAASYLWSNAAACVATDILVQNGKLTMTLRNITTESFTITAVRLLLIYEL
jgi:hypothetical protein